MAKLIALYGKPTDAQAFDDYYFGRHVPLAKTIPGLQRYEVSSSPVMAASGPSQYHLVAELSFASLGDLQGALNSAAGKAAGADLGNFATGGVDLLVFDSRDV